MSEENEKTVVGRPLTDFGSLLHDLNAGVYEQQINLAMSDVPANVVTHGKKGLVQITLEFEQIGESHQAAVTHSLKVVTPKQRGRVIEETESETPLHVERGGKLTLFPNAQTRFDLGATKTAIEQIDAKAAKRTPTTLFFEFVPFLGFASRKVAMRLSYHPGPDGKAIIVPRIVGTEAQWEEMQNEFKMLLSKALGKTSVTIGSFTLGR